MTALNTQTKNRMDTRAELEKLTVLIVDKKQVDSVLEKNIMSFGDRVIVAECYRHAIQAATNTRNDLITINMNLPGRDGIQILSKIKEVVGSYNVVSTDPYDYDTGHEKREQQTLYYIKKTLEVNDIQSILEHISRRKIFCSPVPN